MFSAVPTAAISSIKTGMPISTLQYQYFNASWIALTLAVDPQHVTGVQITDFKMPDKTSSTIKYLSEILKIHPVSCLHSQVQTSPTCLPAKMWVC